MSSPLPYTGPGPSPLRLYLRAEEEAIWQIIADLRDAAAEAQRRINKLETKHGIGAQVERAQLQLVRRELAASQAQLWRSIGKNIRTGSERVALAAAEAEEFMQTMLFRAVGAEPPAALVAAQREYAKATVKTYLARGQNGVPLSEKVYRTRQLANGFVDRAVNRVILRGGSWQDIAKAVRPMIHPDTPGGVSYAAKRLGRTELNNAFHTTAINLADENPYVEGMKWNLSRSHPKPDQCDSLARGHSRGKPEGVYEVGMVPSKPHPQCLCYTTEEVMDEDEFLRYIVNNPPELEVGRYRAAARSA